MKMPKVLLILSILYSGSAWTQEYIHVTKEPFHKPVFQNDSLTVIELKMQPGDTSLFHLHSEPILYLTLKGANMWLHSDDGNARVVELPDGWIGSDNYGVHNPFAHQIAVADSGPLHLIAILQFKASSGRTPVEDDDVIYRGDGFAVQLDSSTQALRLTEKINIVYKGSAFKGNERMVPGDFFFSGQELSEPSENFKYYRVFF